MAHHVFALLTGLLLALAPKATATNTPPPPKLTVLTSFLPLHSLTLAIAGDHVTVENWLPAGVDPHDFQFSPRDLRRLREASLLITAGLGLEGWAEAKLRRLAGNPSLRLVEAANDLPREALVVDPHRHAHENPANHDHDDDHDHEPSTSPSPNPHFWLDPLLMAHAATNILRALQEALPASAESFQRHADDAIASLHRLHDDFARELGTATTPFITYHNAFPYLAKRYRLPLVGVVESGATDQPSARELADLGRLVRQKQARVLFMDGEPPRLARRLSTDLNLQLATLETLETGNLVPNAYEAGMRRNLATLKRFLCAPPTP